jgi:multiple sugar transport system ATP-binding protein
MEGGSRLAWPAARQGRLASATGKSVILGIRPEHMGRASGAPPRDGHARLPVTVELVQPTGSRTYITFTLGGRPVTAEVAAHDVQQPNERIELDLDMNRAILIDPETDRVL